MDHEDYAALDIRGYLALMRRWLWLIAVATLLAASTAFVISRRSTPIYEATTTLLISEGPTGAGPDYNAILMSERLARTYSELLRGASVLDEVSTRLGGVPAATELRDMVKVELVRDTQLIRLSVRHSDPEMAARIVNTLPQVFAEQNARRDAERLRTLQEGLSRELTALQQQVSSTQAALDGERAKDVPDAVEVARLDMLLATYRSQYTSMLSSYEEARLAEAGGLNTIGLVEPARPSSEPVAPRTLTNTLLVAMLGAMLSAGTAFAVEYLDDTIKEAGDVDRTVHLPVFATISRFPRLKSGGASSLQAVNRRSPSAEAYRVLRTNLQFSSPPSEDGAVVLMVTSAQPLEGKTTTLANLGASLAQSGKKVLLVDADLRRPALHTYLGLSNDRGLSSLLLQQKKPEDLIRKTGIPHLSALTAGHLVRNPAEVLGFPETEAVLELLKSRAEYILVDSPPALSVTDALILAQKVDGVLLVAEAGKVRTDAFRRAVVALGNVKAPMLGVVLNKASQRGRGYYYSDYYSGRYAQADARPARNATRAHVLLATMVRRVGVRLGRLLRRREQPDGTV